MPNGARSKEICFVRVLHTRPWAIVLALTAVAFSRLVAWDQFQVFAMADALGALVYVPAC